MNWLAFHHDDETEVTLAARALRGYRIPAKTVFTGDGYGVLVRERDLSAARQVLEGKI